MRNSIPEIQAKGLSLLLRELRCLIDLAETQANFGATFDLCFNALNVYQFAEKALKTLLIGVLYKSLSPRVTGGKWLEADVELLDKLVVGVTFNA